MTVKKQKTHSQLKKHRHLIVAVAFLVAGLASVQLYLRMTSAAVFATVAEAESGAVAGAAGKVAGQEASGASGSAAVRFGGQATGGGCVVPSGQKLQDQDTSDSAETPWKRTAPEVIVYFEYGKVIAEHKEYIKKAAEYWGRSDCLDTRAIETCPGGQNCITARSVSGNNGDTDGEFTETGKSGGFRTGGRVDLFTDVLNQEKPNGRLVTTVHEYGHGVGLIHRKDKTKMMNETTDDSMDPEPDEIDYQNLLVIYGTKI